MITDLATSAAAATACGWPVFPVAPGGKRPAVKNWEAAVSTDPDQIAAIWARIRYNIGIAGLIVIDLDRPKPGRSDLSWWNRPGIANGADVLPILGRRAGESWPRTRIVRTPTGGLHLYFAAPAEKQLRNTQGRLGWKSTPAPPAATSSPQEITPISTYTVINDRPPVALPAWLTTSRPVSGSAGGTWS